MRSSINLSAQVLLVLFTLVLTTEMAAASCSPTQGGKYYHQIAKLFVPDDEASYSDCHDYGFWSKGSYKGHHGIPAGYWVYSAPYWYVFAEKSSDRRDARSDSCSPDQGRKYSGEMHKLYLPKDARSYGRCHDYGWWGNRSYAGYNGLQPGYWVYAYPHWYVWRRKN